MFDPSAPHIIILLVVVLLLFGASRLPGAAEALGKSMRIFKKEAKALGDDDKNADATVVKPAAQVQAAAAPPPLPSPPVPDPTQQQIADLQRQMADLQRQSPGRDSGAAGDAPVASGTSAADGAQSPRSQAF